MSDEEKVFRRVLEERDNARHELDRQVNLRVTAESEAKELKKRLHAAESGNKELQHELRMKDIALDALIEIVRTSPAPTPGTAPDPFVNAAELVAIGDLEDA